jgi:parallel beta helix pectate lyase-like protein
MEVAMALTKTQLRNCCACSSAQRIFDIRCYGAVGDGETDDLPAILAARDAVTSEGGGVLFFPRGTFVISDTVELGANTTARGVGAGSVILAKRGVAAFNLLRVRNSDNVRVEDLVLDGNKPNTSPPSDSENENVGCGLFGQPVDEGQTGLSISNVIARHHYGSGIRIIGPSNSGDPYCLNPNEVEVTGCRIADCGGRGVIITRATRARVAANVITSCTSAGIQLLVSRDAVIDGNMIEKTQQKENTHGGHGIAAAHCFDYVIVNNVVNESWRWGIVAAGGLGAFSQDHEMSKRYVVANNVCRGNRDGGITIDPTVASDRNTIQPSFATVAANVCVGNTGHGIQATHAAYVSLRGNICDGNENAGIAIISSRHAVVADNVLTANGNYGIAFRTDPDVTEAGQHLLGGNVFDKNTGGEILIVDHHPPIRQLQDRWPVGDAGGMNVPVKPAGGEPSHGVDGAIYLNTTDRKLQVYAGGAWHTLQGTTGQSW